VSNNDVGTLPVGFQFFVILLPSALPSFCDPSAECSESRALGLVSDLEFHGLHLLVVSRPYLLLIGYDADLGLLTTFLRVI